MDKLKKDKLPKLVSTVDELIKDYLKVRFRNENPATILRYEDFFKEVFRYWMDTGRPKAFKTRVFYDLTINSFSDFESNIESVWRSNNKNQYIYLELRNMRNIFAEQNYKENKFRSQQEMYQQYAISEKEAILLVKDFTDKLIEFHAQQEKTTK